MVYCKNNFKKIKADILRSFFKDVFIGIKCPAVLYEPVINGLVETSLRGVDSHGIRLMPHYVEAALLGRVNLSPQLIFKETSQTTSLLDADHTFGMAAATIGMEKAIELARRSGVGCVAVSNSSHFGAAAIYTLMAARKNMLGFSFTSVDSLVLPFGGTEPFLGTNPISFAAPCEGEEPFCLDMATSIISWNKLKQYCIMDEPLESGWAADGKGEICTNPHMAQSLLPIGNHKGYGLALMVEVLCSLLTGMPYGKDIPKMFPLTQEKRQLGHFLIAIDISKFQEVTVFMVRMKRLLDNLRSLVPADGFGAVSVANDPEKKVFQKRVEDGVPIANDDLENFCQIAKKLKIDIRNVV